MIAFAQQKSSAWRMSRRKPGLDLIRAGYRFAEKDMRHSMTSSAADLKFLQRLPQNSYFKSKAALEA